MIELSVVIPSYNSSRTIRECLNSLIAQEGFNRFFDVIVVDSGEDSTAEIVRKEYPEVHLIKNETRLHQAAARNIGMQRASGEIVGFIDSDCVARPDWVTQMILLHEEHPEVLAVTGIVLNGTPYHPVGTLSYLMEFNEFVPGSPERYIGILLGGNLSVKKNRFREIGIQFPNIYHSEDTLLAARIVEEGGTILFSPRVGVYHLNRTSMRDLLRHAYILGKASAKARKKASLYGRWLRRFPALSVLLPFIRWARGFSRLIRFNRLYALQFALLTPLYLIVATSWSLAFGLEIGRDDHGGTEPVFVHRDCNAGEAP